MSILPDKYDKYIRFFSFIHKYWNSDLFIDEDSDDELIDVEDLDPSPEELAEDLQKMGPSYVKLGQLLSTRPDMLPQPYLEALERLQDNGDKVSFEEVQQVFEEELGTRISKAFKEFNPEPMASASIGQVHEAILHSGEKVAVKIQRPDVRKRFVEDLDTLMMISEKAEQFSKTARKYSIHNIIEELRYILLQELDYTKEAQNLTLLKENMKEFDLLFVPSPISDYCAQRVLTMQFVDGKKVTTISPMKLMELPTTLLVDDFIKGYLKQIIIDGFAHADPHPGNIHLTKDNRLALMDLGMVARFSDELQEGILKIMICLGNNDGDGLVNQLLELSEYDEKTADLINFKKKINRKVQETANSTAQDLETGQLIMKANQIAAQNGIQLPVELSILGKILLNMDKIIAFLAPEYDFQKAIRGYLDRLMRKRMFKEIKSGHGLQTLLESKELLENLPHRLNKISENLAENKIRVKVDAFDEHRFILAFQKVANRITIGLVIASLVLGAALLMRIPTTCTIWGYPGFAILLFIFAASIGFYLIYRILFTDESNSED